MRSTRSTILDDHDSKTFLLLALLLFAMLSTVGNSVIEWSKAVEDSASAPRPNILLIIADDLGYDDTSAINSGGLHTPSLAHLAQQGVTFRRHYADATCTPSRVAILSGRYPERSGFRPVGSEIPAEFATIAEQLKAAGYATYLTGKWHAGEARTQAWPQHKGFDRWFGFLNQWELSGEVTAENIGRRKPTYINPMLRVDGGELQRHSGHLTDILTDHTVEKIHELQSAGDPWFIYHAFLAPHQPIQPHERYASQFPDTPEGRYIALVAQLDHAIGRLLDAVDGTNTLVLFVSDNGGTNRERNNNFPFYGKKGEMYEGALRTPLIISWPGLIPKGRFIDDVVMNVDIYPTLLAAAGLPAPDDLDGINLWPLFAGQQVGALRKRSWEVYSDNVETLSFSFLADSGAWRLASLQGFSPSLFNLLDEPSGEHDVSALHATTLGELSNAFWREHWRKSVLPVREVAGDAGTGTTLYHGFDAMRTPNSHGFAMGLAIGPLPPALASTERAEAISLAGQTPLWELRFLPGRGLEWRMDDIVLRDPYFDPSKCNAIVVTGYIEPMGYIAKRAPQSRIKLYSSGLLRDFTSEVNPGPVGDAALASPTFVNHQGKARFSNLMLSSFADGYSPRLRPEFIDIYTSAHRDRTLSLPEVAMMDAELCR